VRWVVKWLEVVNFLQQINYIVYWIEMIQNSQSISGNYSNVTVRVWCKRTNTGYTTYETAPVIVLIAGTAYSAGITNSQTINKHAPGAVFKNIKYLSQYRW